MPVSGAPSPPPPPSPRSVPESTPPMGGKSDPHALPHSAPAIINALIHRAPKGVGSVGRARWMARLGRELIGNAGKLAFGLRQVHSTTQGSLQHTHLAAAHSVSHLRIRISKQRIESFADLGQVESARALDGRDANLG